MLPMTRHHCNLEVCAALAQVAKIGTTHSRHPIRY